MALQAQRAGAEAALVDLEAAVNGGVRATGKLPRLEMDEAAVVALATTVLDDLAWSEMWRDCQTSIAPPPPTGLAVGGGGATKDPGSSNGILPGHGRSLSGTQKRHRTRKSAPSAMESSEERVKTGAGWLWYPCANRWRPQPRENPRGWWSWGEEKGQRGRRSG